MKLIINIMRAKRLFITVPLEAEILGVLNIFLN